MTIERLLRATVGCALAVGLSATTCAESGDVSGFPVYRLTVEFRGNGEAGTESDGQLRISGTARLPVTRDDGKAAIRFRLLANAEDIEPGLIDAKGRTSRVEAELVGSFGSGLDAISVWQLPVEQTALEDGQAVLSFSYRVSGTQEIFHVGEDVAFASGLNLPWYPQPPSMNRAVGSLRILAPEGMVAVAAGRRTSSPQQEADGVFEFAMEAPISPSFAIGAWQVTESTAGSVPVRLYRRELHRSARAQIAKINRILDTLEDEFGPYPYSEFSIVDVAAPVANDAGFGGVSLEGWMIAYEGAWADEISLCFFGHEIAHQWWGNQIRSMAGEIPDGLIDEGLANYAGHLVIEALDGPAAATEHRKLGCSVMGWLPSALGYFAQVAAGEDQRLAELSGAVPGAEALKDNKLYFVWLELARTLGREKFRAGLREIVRRHATEPASFADIVAALETGSGVPAKRLTAFFDQWLGRTGAPELSHRWSPTDEGVRIELRQSEPAYQLQVPLRLYGRSGETADVVVSVDGPTATHSIPAAFPVWAVDLDPDYTFLHRTTELHAAAQPLGHYLRGLRADDLTAALRLYDAGIELIPQPDLHSARMILEYGRGRAYARDGRWAEALDRFLAAAQAPTRRPDVLPAVYRRIAEVAIELEDRPLFDWALAATKSADAAAGYVTSAPAYVERMLFPSPEPASRGDDR